MGPAAWAGILIYAPIFRLAIMTAQGFYVVGKVPGLYCEGQPAGCLIRGDINIGVDKKNGILIFKCKKNVQ